MLGSHILLDVITFIQIIISFLAQGYAKQLPEVIFMIKGRWVIRR